MCMQCLRIKRCVPVNNHSFEANVPIFIVRIKVVSNRTLLCVWATCENMEIICVLSFAYAEVRVKHVNGQAEVCYQTSSLLVC